MKLLIVESPAKAKTISKYLDGAYTVKASVGHIRDLPKNNKKAIDLDGFVPHYEICKGKEDVVAEIKALSKKATEVLLATDPDREGEAIAWHIQQAVGLKKPKRIVFHEITKDAVQEAVKHPRDIDENLRKAQEARRVLDRLVGYDLSGLIWKKVRYGLSAGRVQSPALRIIMEREREIRAFIPETFWVLSANVKTEKGIDLLLTAAEEPRDKKRVNEILNAANKKPWAVTEVKQTEVKRSPRAPFTTSTLQQAASTRLGFSPARTMGVAQKLYEAGYITYMRTDSTHLSTLAVGQISTFVQKKHGKNYLEVREWKTKSKNAQEAHEAIRPTDAAKEFAGNNEEQKKLYNLIWKRTVTSQMADAKTLRTKITGKPNDPIVPDFSITGSVVLFDGWLKVDPEGTGDEMTLPDLKENDQLKLIDIQSLEKQTEPPSRYSEAGLVKELEKRGIGRPSTYALIIKTLEDRGYVTKENRSLTPTDTGDVVSTFLENNFGNYISDTFTATMEDSLDEIAEGKKEYAKTLKDFYTPFTKELKLKSKNTEKLTDLGPVPPEFKCPVCASPMVYKLSRMGKFMSCSRFPECTGALSDTGEEMQKEKIIGTDPGTGFPIKLLSGRFGPYVQIGDKDKKNPKPRRASVPKDIDLAVLTQEQALVYLSLPRLLGNHPETGEPISANNGRFGPYIVHQKDFRSLKTDNVYTVTLERALEILKEEKKKRGFRKKQL